MVGRKKGVKSISPVKRRDWLRRNEAGETPPQIAAKDKVDPRTVRHHLEIAKEEKNVIDIQNTYLLSAFEAHQEDLIEFAGKLEEAAKYRRYSDIEKLTIDPLWGAFQEHISRDNIWKLLDLWHDKEDKRTSLATSLSSQLFPTIKDLIAEYDIRDLDDDKLILAMVDGIIRSSVSGYCEDYGFSIAPSGADKSSIMCRGMGQFAISPELADDIIEKLNDRFVKAFDLPEYEEMESLSKEIEPITKDICEGLMVYRYKRVVTGKCRFCPI